MAKRTAVIDLGSNSVRLVIFEKTSRYAFHTLCEHKRKVRLGENAYNNGKILQNDAMVRAEETLRHFKELALKEKCKKILIVGTSALRDAPNRSVFISNIRKRLKLGIRCIDGKTESYLGGLAALNLLSNVQNATTLDIGGGSSELCLIKDGKIKDCISLDLGTVRLKELFYDKGLEKGLSAFIDEAISAIPPHFANDTLIAIGGSLRAISNSIMSKNNYPLATLHEFCYDLSAEISHIKSIINASDDGLSTLFIKKERFDTIREGAAIFLKVAKALKIRRVMTSGAGIREGVYLSDILRPSKKFPANFNPSIKSLQDRFLGRFKSKIALFAGQIFDALKEIHMLDENFRSSLTNAAKLCEIGSKLDFYHANDHSAYFIMNALNFNISHEEKALIATIIKLDGRKIGSLAPFEALLPECEVILWLSFILALAKILNENTSQKLEFRLNSNVLYIKSPKNLNVSKEALKKLVLPETIAIAFD